MSRATGNDPEATEGGVKLSCRPQNLELLHTEKKGKYWAIKLVVKLEQLERVYRVHLPCEGIGMRSMVYSCEGIGLHLSCEDIGM